MRKTSKRILTGFIVVILGLSGAYAFSLSRAAAKLQAAQAALEADGRPMDAAAMIPPEVPDEQNAAPFYERAAAALKGNMPPGRPCSSTCQTFPDARSGIQPSRKTAPSLSVS